MHVGLCTYAQTDEQAENNATGPIYWMGRAKTMPLFCDVIRVGSEALYNKQTSFPGRVL